MTSTPPGRVSHDGPALLFYHCHTSFSNRYERAVRGIDVGSHATDVVAIARRLPPGLDAIVVKTDHWLTDREYFDRLGTQTRTRLDVELVEHETHVCFEHDGSRTVVVNGVEGSLERRQNHLIVAGLPIDDASPYCELTIEAAVEAGGEAGWIAACHPGMPGHRYGRRRLDSLVREANAADVPVAIGYPTGYPRSYNKVARGEIPFRPSLREYAAQEEVPLIPELDLHGAVPAGFSGCGVVDGGVVDSLWDGNLPVSGLLSADLFTPSGCQPGLGWGQFLRNYKGLLPGFGDENAHTERFRSSLPSESWLASVDISNRITALP
jgi:hypothetical protein